MARKKNAQLQAAANARTGRTQRNLDSSASIGSSSVSSPLTSLTLSLDRHANAEDPIELSDSDNSDCGYEGGVHECFPSDIEEDMWTETDDQSSSKEMSDFDKEMTKEVQAELALLSKPTQYETIGMGQSAKAWSKIEKNRNLGYNGNGRSTKFCKEKEAREREEEAKTLTDPQIVLMCSMFAAKPKATPIPVATSKELPAVLPTAAEVVLSPADVVDYLLDRSDDDSAESADGSNADNEEDSEPIPTASTLSRRLPTVPPRKRRRLDTPVWDMCKRKKEERVTELQKGLTDIKKLIKSPKTVFVAGPTGLQLYRACTIQSYLLMAVKNGCLEVDASEKAAESQGFAAKWGGKNVRAWTRQWLKSQELPASRKEAHGKVYSLLDNPAVKVELRTYVRSNRWAMDPSKLADFMAGKLLPDIAKKYGHAVVREEMPRGLKKYMEAELLPRLQLKVKRGISLSTARRWLPKEGFSYTGHKKDVYFDGHDHPDVVAYCQKDFLPWMAMELP
ncbi:hypothetical protein C8R45DRAFT_942516 [Mycena sanguinolenta]|nr:hypothetical protein C8R45DRAFT_942516 [Mycena sanguinolenta]